MGEIPVKMRGYFHQLLICASFKRLMMKITKLIQKSFRLTFASVLKDQNPLNKLQALLSALFILPS